MEIIKKIKVDLNYPEKKANIKVIQEFEEYSLVRNSATDSFYFVDKEDQKVSEEYGWITYCKETDMFIVRIRKNQKNTQFYMDKNLNRISENYEDIESFENGLSLVNKYSDSPFFVNLNFERVSPLYEGAKNSEQEYLVIKENGKWYYVNRDFKKVSGPYAEEICTFDSKGTAIINRNGRNVLINKSFKTVSFEYSMLRYFSERYIQAIDGMKICLLDRENNFKKCSPVYDGMWSLYYDRTHYIVVSNKKSFIVNKNFERVSEYFDGFWGGHFLGTRLYEEMLIARKAENSYYLVDIKNNLKFSEEYNQIYKVEQNSDYIIVKKNGKWHFIDKSFIKVSEDYDLILPSTDDFNYNFVQKNGIWYILDRNLEVVTQRTCGEEELKGEIKKYNSRKAKSFTEESYIDDSRDIPFDADAKIKGHYSCVNMDGCSIVIEDEDYATYLEKSKAVKAKIDNDANFEELENISEVKGITRVLN